MSLKYQDIYHLTEEVLGQGAYAVVKSCTNRLTGQVYAVKIIEKVVGYSRAKVLREIELNYKCQGHKNIIQLIEFFEEEDKFYLVFEKADGGQLTEHLANKLVIIHLLILIVLFSEENSQKRRQGKSFWIFQQP